MLALALAASAVGLATYDDTRRAATFDVAWTTRETTLAVPPATHPGEGELALTLPVDVANLTRVAFSVTVEGSGARVSPVEVLVEVRAPGDDRAPLREERTLDAGAQSRVTATFDVPLRDVPDEATVQAPSPDRAHARVVERHASSEGQGDWTFVVSLSPSGARPVPETYTVRIDGVATSYEAQVRVATAEVPR